MKTLKWLIIGILAGAALGYFVPSCRDSKLKRENADLKAQITEQTLEVEALEKTHSAERDALLEQIGGLQGNIDSLMTVNAELETQLSDEQVTGAQIGAQVNALVTEVQPVLDANPRVKELVLTLMAQVANKDSQIFTLSSQKKNLQDALVSSGQKFQAQLKITDTYKADWESELGLRRMVETRLNLQDRRVGILERRSKLTIGGAALAVGAAALLSILSK